MIRVKCLQQPRRFLYLLSYRVLTPTVECLSVVEPANGINILCSRLFAHKPGPIARIRLEIVLQRNIQDHADIADLWPGEVLKDWNEVKQFVVVGVAEPAADWYGMLGMEDV